MNQRITGSCKLSHELFHRHFTHVDSDGELYWKLPTTNRVKKGAVVGAIDVKQDGRKYLRTALLGTKLYVHRIICVMNYGPLPVEVLVDHEDGDGLNNRLYNLFLTDAIGNGQNTKMHSNNTSGTCGVCWFEPVKMWWARIAVAKRQVSLGYYKQETDAIAARKAAEIRYGFSKRHGTTYV